MKTSDFTMRPTVVPIAAAAPTAVAVLSANCFNRTARTPLAATANLESHTRDFAVRATRIQTGASVRFEEDDVPWRVAPGRWPLVAEVTRRHELEDGWRAVWRTDLSPLLERWQEALRASLPRLGGPDWLPF